MILILIITHTVAFGVGYYFRDEIKAKVAEVKAKVKKRLWG